MKKSDKNRRYYLHAKVKAFCNADTRQRTVFITDGIVDSLNEKQKSYLFELRDRFKYNLQYIIV